MIVKKTPVKQKGESSLDHDLDFQASSFWLFGFLSKDNWLFDPSMASLVVWWKLQQGFKVQISWYNTFFSNHSVRGQNDWPAPTSKASSPWCHPPLHLRQVWRRRKNRKRDLRKKRKRATTKQGEENYSWEDEKGWGGTHKIKSKRNSEGRQWENRRRDKYKSEGRQGSKRGVVGKSVMKGEKSQLDKQTNISQKT